MRYFAFTKETDGGPLNLAVSKQINSKQYGLTSLVNYKPFSKSRDSTQGNHWPHLHGVWMKMNVVGFERNPVIETMSTNNAFYRGDFSNKELLCQTIWQTWIMKDSQPLEPCSAQFVKALEGEITKRRCDADWNKKLTLTIPILNALAVWFDRQKIMIASLRDTVNS